MNPVTTTSHEMYFNFLNRLMGQLYEKVLPAALVGAEECNTRHMHLFINKLVDLWGFLNSGRIEVDLQILFPLKLILHYDVHVI